MRYKIFEKGEEINVIVASDEFVTDYCAKNGYTFEEDPLPESPEPETPETEPSVWDELAAAYKEGVNSAYEQ